MKIGILTFPNSKSYGAALQMRALYYICQKLGYDVEIINYHNLWMKQEKHTSFSKGKHALVLWVKKRLIDLIHNRMIRGFRSFEDQMIKYPPKAISDKKQLPLIADRYKAVICGSDQVWNPDITNYDKSFFLDFCGSNTARISYAPSFGVDALPAAFGKEITKELEKFEKISVREEAGQKILRELLGEPGKLVIDPTLLMNSEQWTCFETQHPQATGDYILYYTIRSSQTLWKHCLELARKTNLKILRIGSNAISKQFKKTSGVEYVCDVTPDQWLYLLHNASYVVTNSFHGTAFSINYRKNFFVEFSSLTNSRLSNIIDLFGLEDRVLKEHTETVLSQPDYSKAEETLDTMRSESMDFLQHALEAASVKYGE